MYNVIIVEDDLMVCAILERQISRFQQLKLVGNFRRGTDALEWLAENPNEADLVVLDYYMPGLTGIEFLGKLRESNKEIQVIMITSANEYEVIRDAMNCGICDYVLKPFTSARLEKAISKFDTIMKLKAETHVWTQDKVDVLLCPHKHYNVDNSEAAKSIRANKINGATLENVRAYMKTKSGVKMPLTEISEGMGLSTVTMRRYLKHLNSLGEVNITLDCKTGGRPSEIFEYKG
ncbi:MAG: response regulator [Oscillospiraceae bacterium]|nr:response regulator [Oscillospiraceae bacterium]